MSDKTNKKPLYKRWYIIVLCILLVVTFIFNLKYTFVLVAGNSMNPTYNGKQVLIADKKDTEDLERFDVVIVYTDKNNKYTIKEKYLYYVACTRSQHQLIIYNQD